MNKIEQLKEARITYDNHKKIADDKYKEMKNIGDSFTKEEFESMNYEALKENKGLITGAISYDSNTKILFNEILQSKRFEKYPQLRKACYYPELNEIDFLTEDEIKGLDKYLCERGTRSYISSSCTAWDELVGINDYDVILKLKDRLVELGIATKSYKISCGCGSWDCEDKNKSEEEKQKFYEYHKKLNKKNYNIDEYFEKGYFTIFCGKYEEEIEIDSINKWEDHLYETYYKIVKEPNRECDEL